MINAGALKFHFVFTQFRNQLFPIHAAHPATELNPASTPFSKDQGL